MITTESMDQHRITRLHEQNRKLRLLALWGWGVAGALLFPATFGLGFLWGTLFGGNR